MRGPRERPRQPLRNRLRRARSPGPRPTRGRRSPGPPRAAAGCSPGGRLRAAPAAACGLDQAPSRWQALSRSSATPASPGSARGGGEIAITPRLASVSASSESDMCVEQLRQRPPRARRRPSEQVRAYAAERPAGIADRTLEQLHRVGGGGHDACASRRARTSSRGEAVGQAERREQLRPEERDHLAHLVAVEVEHLDVERREVAVRAGHVQGERRLPVRGGAQHRHVVGAAGALGVDEPADVRGTAVPAGVGRHLPDRVGGEHADDGVDVLAPERLDVLRRAAGAGGRRGRARRSPASRAPAPSGRGRAAARSSPRPPWCRVPRRPPWPTSGARRAGSAPRAGGPAGAGGPR